MSYNLEKVNAISDGDKDFIEAVVVAFVEEIPEDLEKFEQEVQAKNYKGIYQVSHKIKPNLDLLGMTQAYEENLQIVTWSKAETNMSEIASMFESVQQKINETITQLKKEFNLA